ncbi:MAG: hypothetical protein AABN34_21170 [Acidobacteriota bacterium]
MSIDDTVVRDHREQAAQRERTPLAPPQAADAASNLFEGGAASV